MLHINNVTASQEGIGGTIQLFTSQQVNDTDLAAYEKISPAAKFNTEITENGFQIHSDQFSADKSYQLTLNKGIHGKIGGTLQEDYLNNISFGELEPSVSFANTSATTTVSGEKTAFSFTPRSPGEYEIRVVLAGANSYVSKAFYSYGYWGSDQTSFEVNNEGHVDIQLDKTSYYNGESVKALFKAPFDGRLLVTLETAKLISYPYVQVVNRTATIDLKLSAEAIPNAYITVTLIKPHEYPISR
ncbi:MAG TPA: hypothetical protein VFC34_00800 [Puia sp.]|nr:hypothetical protein [Puia sp.]